MPAARVTRPPLVRRSLVWHARSWLAVLLACATTAAIVTGALLVGDSVKGSLRDRVLERLAGVDQALVAGRFFRDGLAHDVAADTKGLLRAAPAILLRGSVVHAENQRRASDVNIIGVDERFLRGDAMSRDWPIDGADVVVNATLAAELDAASGDSIVVSFDQKSDVDREQALGDREGTLGRLRADVVHIADDAGVALFDLRFQQETPRNVFVSLARLARALDREGRANAILVRAGGVDAASLLAGSWTLDDVGVTLRRDDERGYIAVESPRFLLESSLVAATHAAAKDVGASYQDSLTYLANRIGVGDRSVPYSTVTAVGAWQHADGSTSPALASAGVGAEAWRPGGAVLSQWALDDLRGGADSDDGIAIGATVEVEYFAVGADHELDERTASFALRASVPLEGVAADPGWTPSYPGVSDAATFGEWDPPFPFDHSRIRKPARPGELGPDDQYWQDHGTTPKLFVPLEDGQKLWASRFGALTSVRLRAAKDRTLEATESAFRDRLRARLDPAAFGLSFRAVGDEAVASARSARISACCSSA